MPEPMPPTATIDRATLLPALQKLIRALKADLLDRLGESPDLDARLWADAFEPIRAAGRTAQAYETWRDDYLEQVAVAWVLACVFVRYMEDNGLIAETYLAGLNPDRRRQADDAHAAFLNAHPRDTDREYLLDVFRRVGSIPACRDLFAEGKTPLWALGPTGDGARMLLDFWRKIDPETGDLARSFQVENGDTRFLGDLYQDLSEDIRKKYALLQTPDFVERFLLDHTLTPAVDVFPLAEIRVLDPTCGSGHLVLGAFWRLFHLWEEREPNTDRTVLVERAIAASCGVDVNPFAIAITKFRLLLAALHATGVEEISQLPGYVPSVVCGDSLMHGNVFDRRGYSQEWLPSSEPWADSLFAIEDPQGLQKLLSRQYHVVVGNPPYITVKDTKAGEKYRKLWTKSCHRQYSLGVPFTERFFNLTLAADGIRQAGFVGMITANSFMKREFGRKLIEEFLPTVNLTHVIDTSGAFIPGHSTPTVILLGQNCQAVRPEIQAVYGIKGEQGTPAVPAEGSVWLAIVDSIEGRLKPNPFVTTTFASRSSFGKHPWSIGGGGVTEVKQLIEENAAVKLSMIVSNIGRTTHTGEDEAFLLTPSQARTHAVFDHCIPLITGGEVRDYTIRSEWNSLFPYNKHDGSPLPQLPMRMVKHFWPLQRILKNRLDFGKFIEERGLRWFDHSMFFPSRYKSPLSIAFASIASHNHFVLDKGDKVFNRSAPVIILAKGSAESEHLSLIALLNSSTVCFWLKQVTQIKTQTKGMDGHEWQLRRDFDGTKIESIPISSISSAVLPLATEVDALGRRCIDLLPEELVKQQVPSNGSLTDNQFETDQLQAKMVALQEELDWLCYRLYGLMDAEEGVDGCDQPYYDPPELRLGQRAFEIAMARQLATEDLTTSWFERHGSTPVTEIPTHWPESYRILVQRRLDAIRDNHNIALIERPEYKRRWIREPWDDQVRRALRSWLLDRLESGRYWPDPADEPPELASCAALAERAAHDADFLQVAALYAARPDFPLAKLVEELVAAESVPLLPALRYKPSGRTKRLVWERTWDLQRREDAGEDVGAIPVPPKYTSADFLSADAWRLRGKLDVPKERFVSFPHAGRDGDPSLVVGWAGWDHLRQAQALTAYYERMKSREGWPADRLVPLLAGLDQLVPWLLQWHNDLDPEYDLRMGDSYRDFLIGEAQALGYTLDQVRAWEPPAKAKGGRGRKKA